MTIFMNFWLLPILFILHDFEEIILVPLWKIKHKKELINMKKPYFGEVTNASALSIGILEEMIILVIASIISYLTNNNILYLSFLCVYTIHFLLHYKMCLQFKGYVPGVFSATLQLPFMIFLIYYYFDLTHVHFITFMLYFIPVFFIIFVNLKVIHHIMPKIENKINSYIK